MQKDLKHGLRVTSLKKLYGPDFLTWTQEDKVVAKRGETGLNTG